MMGYLLVALGGAIGSVARYGVSVAAMRAWGAAFPWGTILINGTGSLAIGAIAVMPLQGAFLSGLRLFLMVGICGGYTTFSAFSLQTLDLLRDGRPGQALGNIVLSLVVSLGGVVAGYAAIAYLTGRNTGA